MRVLFILIALVLSTSIYAQKQDTLLIEPGSKYVNGSFIKNYTNKWDVSFVDLEGNKVMQRIWTDYGETVELGGKLFLHRVQDIYTAKLVHIDTWINMVELSTLKPWQFYSIKPSGSNSFYQFSDSELIINSNVNKNCIQESDTTHLNKPLFDWNLYGMLLVGFPFKNDAIYKFPYYNALKQKVDYLTVSVEGKEVVTNRNNQQIDVWKFKCSDGLTFWLTKDAPYVIQLELIIPDKGKMFWNSY